MESHHQVLVLFDGYSEVHETFMKANCTSTLIKGPQNMIVDTMTAWDGDKIEASLKALQLSCADIDYVVCTHGHSDHIGCNYLFKNALHIVGHSISKRDIYYDHNFLTEDYQINSDVKVVATPGHTLQDVSVIVNTKQGVVAITGDLFEKEEDLSDSSIWKGAGSDNESLQEINRSKILEIADYIIPGHGPKFANKNKIKECT